MYKINTETQRDRKSTMRIVRKKFGRKMNNRKIQPNTQGKHNYTITALCLGELEIIQNKDNQMNLLVHLQA